MHALLSTPHQRATPGRGRENRVEATYPTQYFSLQQAGILRDLITNLTFPAGCICTGSWGEARSPGAGCKAWGCMGRREDCREQCQQLRQPEAPLSIGSP